MSLKFTEYLEEERGGKNLHLDHLEDLIFLDGIIGLRNSIQFLQNLRNMLEGHSAAKTRLTTKWDGAPAVFCGINPDNGKFFVATKGAFNADPKLCYTSKDVDTHYPNSGLNTKLKIALDYLPDLGITNVLQGDMMFTQGEPKIETIDGQKYVTFRPNTITYAIPADTDLANRVLNSKIGIVFHTTYRGRPFANMKASFGADITPLKPSRAVWYRDASFVDASGTATFTTDEGKEINEILGQIGSLFHRLSPAIVNKISTVEAFRVQLMAWNNAKVRSGETVHNVPTHVSGFIKSQEDRLSKHALEAKKHDTKAKRAAEKTQVMHFWKDKTTVYNLQNMMQIYNLIIEAKLKIVRKLEQVQDIGTFIKTTDGYKVTKAEGFVAIDHLSGGAIKLVDRLEFSHANFTVAKDWKK